MKTNRRPALLARILVFFVAATVAGRGFCAGPDEMPLPPKLQAALFQKIFGYDKAIGSAAAAKLLIVFPDSAPGAKDDLVKNFADIGVAATTVKVSALGSAIAGSNVVYLMPGTAMSGAKQLCSQAKVLAISGVPAYAETGTVAVALDSIDNKPKIVVNLTMLKACEHQLSPDLLKLSKIVQ